MRPVQGPKKKFDSASEMDMSSYCDFGWEVGIPRTQEQFAQELVHFMDYYGITNKFAKVVPGKTIKKLSICVHAEYLFFYKSVKTS